VFASVALAARAHVELEQYLQQRATAVVTPAHIDLTLEILFTSPVSLAERTKMDANGDGALSENERRAYLDSVAERAEEDLKLRIDGELTMLTPLYDAELDFLDSEGVAPHPHVLRLFYFARTPEAFHNGSTLTLDSRLCTDGPSLVASSVRGEQGIKLRGAQSPGLTRPSGPSKFIRILEAKCVSKGESGGAGDKIL